MLLLTVQILAVVSLLPFQTSGLPKHTYKLGFPTEPHDAYAIYQDTIPEKLQELSVCFFSRLTNNVTDASVFSYAVPQKQNEILALINFFRGAAFYIRHTGSEPRYEAKLPQLLHENQWMHVCMIWSMIHKHIQVYADGKLVKEAPTDPAYTEQPVRPKGIAVLGQDQDKFGGDFHRDDSWTGDISEVHLWNRALRAEEVECLATCNTDLVGNIFNWHTSPLALYNGVVIGPVVLCDEK